MMQTSKMKAFLLLLATYLVFAFGVPRAHAAEEPLAPEFLEYLGTVESSGLQGMENLSLEEIYQMLKKALKERISSQKKEENPHKKESEHVDAPTK